VIGVTAVRQADVLAVQALPRGPGHVDALQQLIGPDRVRELRAAAARIRDRLDGGTLWHVNSTAAGGGVAEMLHTLLPLYRDLGVRVGWAVIGGDERFFTLTKRLGTALYGSDGGPLGPPAHRTYTSALSASADALRALVTPADVLVLHDHQTAGLAAELHGDVSAVYWRCHVGVDQPTPASDAAWAFLRPYLAQARGLVFSVARHVPRGIEADAAVIPPFVSPFSPKSCDLDSAAVSAALGLCGLGAAPPDSPLAVPTPDGAVTLENRAHVVAEAAPDPAAPLLVQVSRWDRLKDMDGVLAAFASCVDDGYLALVGPDPDGIPDDVEQGAWFERCLQAWRRLPLARRRRAALLCLPMADLTENAVLVNAIQRAADVVLQKSLAEGFGLTVTEAMWKSRLVLASGVGGIREQITHGVDGLLVDDPTDLEEFGALMASAAEGGTATDRMRTQAHRRVLRDHLPDREITAFARLLGGNHHEDR
jgi:trehalose synthase